MIRRSSAAVMCFRLAVVLAVLAIGPLSAVGAESPADASKLMTVCIYGEVDCKANNGLTAVGNRLFFLANDGVHGQELWVSDGAPSGTYLVKDIFPEETGLGVCSDCSWSRMAYEDKLLFRVDNESGTRTMWTSDGTEGGTQPVIDLPSFSFLDFNGLPLIWVSTPAGQEIWKTDGTAAGTTLLGTIPVTTYDKAITFVSDVYFYILFEVPDPEEYGIYMGMLWRTDGTSAGTIQLAEIPDISSYSVTNLVSMKESVYFITNFSPPDTIMTTIATLWKSDGTPEGTQVVATFPYQRVTPIVQLAATEDLVFFAARKQNENPVLWQSDGSPAGTVPVTDAGGPYHPGGMTPFHGEIFFYSVDPVLAYYITAGRSTGIELFADWLPHNLSHRQSPVVIGDALFYMNSDGVGNDVWWRTDGVQKFALVSDGSPYTKPTFAIAVGSTFLFSAETPEMGRELWISNGAPSSTRLLVDLPPNPRSSPPSEFVRAGGKVFFTAAESNTDEGLWVVDLPGSQVYLPLVRK